MSRPRKKILRGRDARVDSISGVYEAIRSYSIWRELNKLMLYTHIDWDSLIWNPLIWKHVLH
ncbi:hypothetical protein M431DRAFT_403599 [Trichoderma harzianum CBS 226.95]|uniref:Uncharacterized protein n=1 Tax=Trichoderma harzianum CBS 226.95 TaxID=983964 RepID=A0A2T4AEV6_TRIHA|nr:hypothetical protein M431DRAFT_403599 [Trichoderma harzianum CBS 226.95]PTB55553.1 hypothetical protein M431DRAFT_403599 [Trichoderma harzianum CBS 226.95]